MAAAELARAQVVVARCRERCAPWVRALASRGWRVRVYDKGDEALQLGDGGGSWPQGGCVECVACANVGREAETWLRHVAERYDALADLTIFLQGNPFDHLGIMHGDADTLHARLLHTLRAWLDAGSAATHALWLHGSRTVVENEGQLKLAVGAYYEELMSRMKQQNDEDGIQPPIHPPPARWRFSAGAQYAVPRDVLRQVPRVAYERWRAMSAATRVVAWDGRRGVEFTPDSVDPWTLERLWPSLWAPRLPTTTPAARAAGAPAP